MLGLSSCRKDDVCTAGGTPKLGLAFYDYNLPDTPKTIDDLTLIALPQSDTILKNEAAIQLEIALNVNADTSTFVFVNNQNPDTLQFNYDRELVFVSKSCGYKCFFNNLNISITPDADIWIKQITILKNNIQNDTIHVQIFH